MIEELKGKLSEEVEKLQHELNVARAGVPKESPKVLKMVNANKRVSGL